MSELALTLKERAKLAALDREDARRGAFYKRARQTVRYALGEDLNDFDVTFGQDPLKAVTLEFVADGMKFSVDTVTEKGEEWTRLRVRTMSGWVSIEDLAELGAQLSKIVTV